MHPLFAALELLGVIDRLAPIPTYEEFAPEDRVCNPRPIQDVGRHLIHRLIDKGMIIEIDHLSPDTLFPVLDILEERSYSGLVSSHGWIENHPEVRDRIFALGGMMSPSGGTPSGVGDAATRAAPRPTPSPRTTAA